MNETKNFNNIPPIGNKRNEFGLLEQVDYIFTESGNVDWRKMVKPEFLVVNKQSFERRNQTVPASTEGLDDSDLLILLGGIKDLARLRGYSSVTHTPIQSGPGFCSVRTTIQWLPNFETSMQAVSFDSLADASERNTQGFSSVYLSAIAENRGFVRAVRNFLGINIAGKDEVGVDSIQEETKTIISNGEPSKFLEQILERNNIKFESFKNRMVKEKIAGAEDWNSVSDIPSAQIWEIADIVNKLLEARKQKQS